MKKRLVTAVLMVCLAFSLVACGGGNGSDKNTEKTNTEDTQKDDAQANKDTETESEDVEDGKIEYKVTVVDANGAPVAGKMVQVCNASTCFAPVQTDANGVATFRLEESDEYKAKELTQSDDAYVYFEAGATELTITLAE